MQKRIAFVNRQAIRFWQLPSNETIYQFMNQVVEAIWMYYIKDGESVYFWMLYIQVDMPNVNGPTHLPYELSIPILNDCFTAILPYSIGFEKSFI